VPACGTFDREVKRGIEINGVRNKEIPRVSVTGKLS